MCRPCLFFSEQPVLSKTTKLSGLDKLYSATDHCKRTTKAILKER